MSSPRNPAIFLADMAEACRLIAVFTAGKNEADYEADALLRSAVERQFQIVGEALILLNRHAPELASRITDFQQIISFRHVLVHGYALVQNDVVWSIAVEQVGELALEVQTLLRTITKPDG